MTTSRHGRPGGKLPLYRRVEAELLGRIRAGKLAPGQRLPTETELAAEWEVNRLTIRQAIGELARAGHVTVRQGSGTYVAQQPLVFEFALPPMPSTDADAGSTTSLREHVQQDQTETLVEISDRDTSTSAAAALGVPGPFVRVETLIETGGQPFVVSSYWLDAQRFPGFADHITERVALFQVLQEHYGLRLRHAWRSLTATVAGREDATLLDIPPGSPLMLRDGVNVDHDRIPTTYVQRRLRGDRARFTLRYDTS